MKRIGQLGLAAALALAFTGALAASASASTIEAHTYPATLTGTGNPSPSYQHELITDYWGAMQCGNGPSFTAELEGATEGPLAASPEDATCTNVIGGEPTMEMSGCEFIFNFGPQTGPDSFAGTLDIGPSECGPITIKTKCTVTIPAQGDLDVSFINVEEGADLQLEAEITGMTYTQSGLCGGSGTGTFEDGEYKGTWLVEGTYIGENTDIQLSEPPSFGFKASEYPASVHGTQSEAGPFVFKFFEGSYAVECEAATFAGDLTQPSATLRLAPSQSGCSASAPNGKISATVTPNGCVYESYPAADRVDIECPEGKAIEIKIATCKVVVPEQSHLTTLADSVTSPDWWPYGVTLDWDGVDGVTYQLFDAIFCPFEGDSERSDGEFEGTTTLGATNSEEEMIGFLGAVRQATS